MQNYLPSKRAVRRPLNGAVDQAAGIAKLRASCEVDVNGAHPSFIGMRPYLFGLAPLLRVLCVSAVRPSLPPSPCTKAEPRTTPWSTIAAEHETPQLHENNQS